MRLRSLGTTLLPLFLIALLAAGPAAAQIEEKTSSVTGATRLESTEMRDLTSKEYPGHASYRAIHVRDPDEGVSWRLSFYGFAEDTTAVGPSPVLRLRADGTVIEPNLLESKVRRLGSSRLLEIKTAEFNRSQFERVARAQNVRVTIGPIGFWMPYPYREDMRLILQRRTATPPTAEQGSAGGS
jgi:hypothetical protein